MGCTIVLSPVGPAASGGEANSAAPLCCQTAQTTLMPNLTPPLIRNLKQAEYVSPRASTRDVRAGAAVPCRWRMAACSRSR